MLAGAVCTAPHENAGAGHGGAAKLRFACEALMLVLGWTLAAPALVRVRGGRRQALRHAGGGVVRSRGHAWGHRRGTGVVELALRYSTVDFGEPVNPTDARPAGDTGHAGRQSNVTAGVNWHLTGHSRLMFNAIRVDLDGAFGGHLESGMVDGMPVTYAAPVTGSFRIYGVRWQYQW